MNLNRFCFVYIIASRSHNLYTGVTNNLERRLFEHREGQVTGFAKRYKIHRLVYYESFGDIRAAIAREKQIKDGTERRESLSSRPETPRGLIWRNPYFQSNSRSLGPQPGPRDDSLLL